MTRSQCLSKRLQEVFIDGQWIANTNYKAQLEQINYSQATTKIGELNTIALLTFHINYYLEGLIHVFNGGPLTISDRHSFTMPAMETQEAWHLLKNDLFKNAGIFIKQVAALEDSALEAVFVKEHYGSFERNIEAVIEHSYYHLGQISLIKKIILSS